MLDVSEIVQLLRQRGDSQYGGEAVTQLEHGMQAASLAEAERAPAELIAAALLHDIGHLLHALPDDAPDTGVDDHHEASAFRYLAQVFGPAVCEPVRLHVAAKRYLCATDPEYLSGLSRPSLTSLQLQGGIMSAAEAAEFRKVPFCEDALRLRRWDDVAKVAGLQTPPLEHFRAYLEAAAVRRTSA